MQIDVAGSDAVRNRRLTRTIQAARDRARDPELAQLLDDVLAGKRQLRDVARSEAFGRAVGPALDEAADAYRSLTDEQREQAMAMAEEQERAIAGELRAEREAARQKPPGRGVPDWDEDDDYFDDIRFLR
ncbi:hypothetical protein LZ318_36845 [Saccharopolyspora indica]|uniref:hypothetical protein n=1 Tax=Saccharopolyspora indica TaxID=1229659 RepID=UPI0022EB9CBC|nr:hypothetical protein [Saccharopolyspora indica]MDA3647726.1 hypothetical protein [Saccharopolyspora indica]